jgi:hypothetical protein
MRSSMQIMPLDEEQLKVVGAPVDSHIRVVSTPGGGKSSVLIARVRHLIETQREDANAMRIMSFSRQSAADVAAKIPEGVHCSTIHSFCSELSSRIEPLHEDCIFKKSKDEEASRELFSPDEFLFRLRDFLAAGKCSFEAVGMLRYLFVDEMQDLCPVQFDIIRLLAELFAVRVFGVGDVKQNIYAFRSSDARFLAEMENLPSHPCISFELTRNYRSLAPIVALANPLVKGSRDMVAARGSKNPLMPTLTCLKDKARELGWLVGRVEVQLKARPPEDIAVITRTRKDAFLLSHKLLERGIPCQVVITEGGSRHLQKDCVSICTMHGSKGLEWPVVFLSNMSDSFNRGLLTEVELQQEENLTYVAVTRARDELHLTCPGRPVSRVLSRVPRDAYTITNPQQELGIVSPFFSKGRQDPFKRTDRSVSGFVQNCSGETFRLMKDEGLIPRLFPGASICKVHAAHSFPEEYSEAKELYGSIVERVVFRQLDDEVRQAAISAGGSAELQNMRSKDTHASACFAFVRTDALTWNTNPPTQKEVSSLKEEVAKYFGLTEKDVAGVDFYGQPAYLGSKRLLYGDRADMKYVKAFDTRIQELRESYRRYISHDFDLYSEDGLQVVANVALCAHICFAPAKTHLLFKRSTFGSLSIDTNLGLFQQTRRVVGGLVQSHFAMAPPKIVESAPAIGDSSFMLKTFGVASDVELSVPSVKGFCDAIIGTTLLEIKASEEVGGVHITWVLQLLIYAALAQIRGLDIQEIAVYNPLKGFLWRAPIAAWTKGADLLNFVADMTSSRVESAAGQ